MAAVHPTGFFSSFGPPSHPKYLRQVQHHHIEEIQANTYSPVETGVRNTGQQRKKYERGYSREKQRDDEATPIVLSCDCGCYS